MPPRPQLSLPTPGSRRAVVLGAGSFGTALDDPIVRDALTLSLLTTGLTLVLAIAIGTPVAWLLARYRFRGRDTIDTLIDLPSCTECDRPRAVLEWRYGTGEWLGFDILSDGSAVPRCYREPLTFTMLVSSELTRKYLGS